MSITNKIIISSLLGLMSSVLCAMEDQKQVFSVSPEASNSSSFLNFTFNDVVQYTNSAVQYTTSKLVSLNNTLHNALSDEAILLKLGWTSSHEELQKKSAKAELQKSKEIYRNAHILKYGDLAYNYNREAKERRRGYLYRAFVILDDHIITKESERISLAFHCLDHHNQIMNSSDKAGFKKIIPYEMWNKKICKKLGWPSSDSDAQKKLKKIKEFYEKNLNNPLNSTEKGSSFLENHVLLEHLHEYCQEILLAFHHNTITDHSERANLALHCIEHHKQILSEIDVAKFLCFAKQSQQIIELNKQAIDEKLTSLTSKKDES